MLEYPTFFHISSKNPDDADIANRKHYSAPEGALTMFLIFIGLNFGSVCYLDGLFRDERILLVISSSNPLS